MNREITSETVKNPNTGQAKPEKITSDGVNISGIPSGSSTEITSDSVINPDTFTDNSEKITTKPVNITDFNGMKKNPMYKNLDIPTTEIARERGRKGGQKSGETKRARKTMRETILDMLAVELTDEKLAEMGIDTTMMQDKTVQSAVISAMLREAVNGSEKAMQLLRDTIGEMPINRTESVTEIITNDDVKLMESMKNTLIS